MKLYKSNNYYPDADVYYLKTSDDHLHVITYWNKTKKVTDKPLGKANAQHPGFINSTLLKDIPNKIKRLVFYLQKNCKKIIDIETIPGFKIAMKDFNPFQIVASIKDPEVDGTFMYLLKFTADNEYGLCIYNIYQKQFVEEPDSLEGYNTTLQQLKTKYGLQI